ncbi:MAG: hypothetical protein ACE5ES_05305 [Candidatus Nanoarchaeia archaeon]
MKKTTLSTIFSIVVILIGIFIVYNSMTAGIFLSQIGAGFWDEGDPIRGIVTEKNEIIENLFLFEIWGGIALILMGINSLIVARRT